MNPIVKEQWIAALRSGQYKQTNGHLRDENGFCCLGVLCDLHSQEYDYKWNDGWYIDDNKVLPKKVAKWAGLSAYVSNGSYPNFGHECLAQDNDNGKTFEEIAQIIEEKF